MNRRTALSLLAGLAGVFGYAATYAQEHSPPGQNLTFQADTEQEIARVYKKKGEMSSSLSLFLDNLPTIEVSFNGKTKHISAKDLFDAL